MRTMEKTFEKLVKSLQEASEFDKTCQLGRFILQREQCTSSSQALSGKDTFEKLKRLLLASGLQSAFIAKNTFLAYLSKAASIAGTDIYCNGRKQGYYTKNEEQIESVDDSTNEKAEVGESALYQLFKDWLDKKGYNSKVTSDQKKNGAWGNPDVVGIRVSEILHQKSIEIVSIECKKTSDVWQKWIFEAVAHRRFSDRAYFAFAQSEDVLPKITEALFRDAEYFRVGILVLKMEDSAFQHFRKTGELGLKNPKIVELYPAPLSIPQLLARKKFFDNQDIREESDLHTFGQEKNRQ